MCSAGCCRDRSLGIALGWWYAASVSEAAVLGLVGAISLVFGLYRLWSGRGGRIAAAARSPGWVGTLLGVASGFTSQIAHAGQPPFQIWVLPRGLDRDTLVGTTAIFFAATNWFKVPAYWKLGQFTPRQSDRRGEPDAGRDRLDARRGVAGAARIAGALLHRDLRPDGAGRRQIGVGRVYVAVNSRSSGRICGNLTSANHYRRHGRAYFRIRCPDRLGGTTIGASRACRWCCARACATAPPPSSTSASSTCR